eukprot:366341-Chlamydomonas_euryale.AAC.2
MSRGVNAAGDIPSVTERVRFSISGVHLQCPLSSLSARSARPSAASQPWASRPRAVRWPGL